MKCRNHFVKKGFLQHYTPTPTSTSTQFLSTLLKQRNKK